MKRILLILVFFFGVGNAEAVGRRGGWSMTPGIGITVSPDTFLLSPQFEYRQSNRLYLGPLVQVGIGNGGALFTTSASARYVLGNHPRMKPSVEGAIGLALASSMFADSVGVHIGAGMGFDYQIDSTLSIGTMIRGNFAPPLKTFFLSWPIFLLRYAL